MPSKVIALLANVKILGGGYFLVLDKDSLKHHNTNNSELAESNYCFAVVKEERNNQGMYAEVFTMWVCNDT